MRAEVRTLNIRDDALGAVPASSVLIHAFPCIPGLDHVLTTLLVKSQQVAVSADGRHACEVVLEGKGAYRLIHSSARFPAVTFKTALILGVTASAARVYARRGEKLGLYDVDETGATALEDCVAYPRVRPPPSDPTDIVSDDGELRARLTHDGILASWVQVASERFGPHLFAWNLHLGDDGRIVYNAVNERGILRIVAR